MERRAAAPSAGAAGWWRCGCRRSRSPRALRGPGRAPAEIVRMRSRGGVEHRVSALPFELGIGPWRPLAAGVLGHVDLVGTLQKRLYRVWRVEVDLGHLPVALVQVGEVVKRVVEPVLDRQPARVRRVGRDVRVHARLATVIPGSEPLLIAAARIERIAREVDVIATLRARHRSLAVGPRVTTFRLESRSSTSFRPRMTSTLVGRYASPGPHGLRCASIESTGEYFSASRCAPERDAWAQAGDTTRAATVSAANASRRTRVASCIAVQSDTAILDRNLGP